MPAWSRRRHERGTAALTRGASSRATTGCAQRLPGDARSRDAAARRSRAHGLPTPREEAWRYTNLRPLAEARLRRAADARSDRGDAAGACCRRSTAPRLVFVDGRFRADLSVAARSRIRDVPARPGVRRAGAIRRASGWWRSTRCWPRTARASTCRRASMPARCCWSASPAGCARRAGRVPSAPRHPPRRRRAADAGRGFRRRGRLSAQSRSLEIDVGEGAALAHIRLQDESTAAFHLATVYADIAARGTYDSFALDPGRPAGAHGGPRAACSAPARPRISTPRSCCGGTQHADFTTVVRMTRRTAPRARR